MSNFQYSVDKLVFSAHGVYGAGWAFDRTSSIKSSTLHISFSDGCILKTDLRPSVPRPDVAKAFPGIPEAIHSGFFFLAGWKNHFPAAAEIEMNTYSGASHKISLEVSVSHELDFGEDETKNQFSSALPVADISDPDRQLILIFHHFMGGGSDFYRDLFIQQAKAEGHTVLLLTFIPVEMKYRIIGYSATSVSGTMDFPEVTTLWPWLSRFHFHHIILNSIVTFPESEKVLAMTLSLKQQSRASLSIVFHDYFPVCPSPFLLNSEGNYCDIPGLETCMKCLARHRDGYVSISGARDISAWRTNWESLMDQDTELICFSESGRQLISKAYPAATHLIRVHSPEVKTMRPVRFIRKPGDPIVAGVIGHISRQKGSEVILDLAQAIEKVKADVRIVVLGTLKLWKIPEQVTVTGPYKHDQLADLIEDQHVNIMLMPSICPETFSFVTHEIIMMGLPLITFNIGAQADLALAYPNGRAVSKTNGYGLLQEILLFDQKIQQTRDR
jgi:glycosyltransferase involved in cell wall biosynthesis